MKAKWKRPMYWATASRYSVVYRMLSKDIRKWKQICFAGWTLGTMKSVKKLPFPQLQVKWAEVMLLWPRSRIVVSIRTPTEAYYRLLNFPINLPFLRTIDQASLKPHRIRQRYYLGNTGPHFRHMFGRTITQPMNKLPVTALNVHHAQLLNIAIFGDHFKIIFKNIFLSFSFQFLRQDIYLAEINFFSFFLFLMGLGLNT